MVISPKLVLSFSLLGEKEKKKNWRFHQLNDQMNHANNIPCQTGRNLQRNPSEVSASEGTKTFRGFGLGGNETLSRF